ncbi:protein-serine/threonine phosphatase [Balamuthia mandrillaris]
MRFGSFSLQGPFHANEDRLVVQLPRPNDLVVAEDQSEENQKSVDEKEAKRTKNQYKKQLKFFHKRPEIKASFFAVYDGHGGQRAVDLISKHLHAYLFEEHASLFCAEDGAAVDVPKVCEAIEQAFAKMEDQLMNLSSGSSFRDFEDDSGSCATVVVSYYHHLIVANLGDCRAVLARYRPQKKRGEAAYSAVELSRDHKATDPEELRRMEERGGFVVNNRAFGILAIARSFGDRTVKIPPLRANFFNGMVVSRELVRRLKENEKQWKRKIKEEEKAKLMLLPQQHESEGIPNVVVSDIKRLRRSSSAVDLEEYLARRAAKEEAKKKKTQQTELEEQATGEAAPQTLIADVENREGRSKSWADVPLRDLVRFEESVEAQGKTKGEEEKDKKKRKKERRKKKRKKLFTNYRKSQSDVSTQMKAIQQLKKEQEREQQEPQGEQKASFENEKGPVSPRSTSEKKKKKEKPRKQAKTKKENSERNEKVEKDEQVNNAAKESNDEEDSREESLISKPQENEDKQNKQDEKEEAASSEDATTEKGEQNQKLSGSNTKLKHKGSAIFRKLRSSTSIKKSDPLPQLQDFTKRNKQKYFFSDETIIAVPEIKTFTTTMNDDFVSLASDGLWDVIPSTLAINLVAEGLKKSTSRRTLNETCELLCREARKKGSQDDITIAVFIIDKKQGDAQQKGESEKEAAVKEDMDKEEAEREKTEESKTEDSSLKVNNK